MNIFLTEYDITTKSEGSRKFLSFKKNSTVAEKDPYIDIAKPYIDNYFARLDKMDRSISNKLH